MWSCDLISLLQVPRCAQLPHKKSWISLSVNPTQETGVLFNLFCYLFTTLLKCLMLSFPNDISHICILVTISSAKAWFQVIHLPAKVFKTRSCWPLCCHHLPGQSGPGRSSECDLHLCSCDCVLVLRVVFLTQGLCNKCFWCWWSQTHWIIKMSLWTESRYLNSFSYPYVSKPLIFW